MPVTVKIEGLERLIRKLDPDLIAGPMRNFLKKSAITVQGLARKKASVDMGRLRSSIDYEVDGRQAPLWAKVGSRVHYAIPQEFGTGSQGEPGVAHKAKHWPPPAALDVWARRHGFERGGQVARIIGRRGGLRAKRFLRGGLEESLGTIKSLLNRMGVEIRNKWEER